MHPPVTELGFYRLEFSEENTGFLGIFHQL